MAVGAGAAGGEVVVVLVRGLVSGADRAGRAGEGGGVVGGDVEVG